MALKEDFDLNTQFKLYLDKSGLSRVSMPADQLRETKRAFFWSLWTVVGVIQDRIA